MRTEEQRLSYNTYMREWARVHPDSVKATFKQWYEERGGRENLLARMAVRYEHHKVRLAEARSEGCVRCGTGVDLHHHHRGPSTKRCKVSGMSTYSDQAFWAEVAKCEVLCCPCHRAEHALNT